VLDRLVAGIRIGQIRQRVVVEPYDPTLANAVKLAQNLDRALSEKALVTLAKGNDPI
jgi:hypothetical protein